MKFTLRIENTPSKFRVHVFEGETEVYDCGYHGGHFIYEGKVYGVYGPSHGFNGDLFRVYEFVTVSEST